MRRVVVARDERFALHLENIPHVESAKRTQAFNSALDLADIQGRCETVSPRYADVEELLLVHTRDHVERIAQSAGKPLTAFDLDTQATSRSYETARLAAGCVFSLLDELWRGRIRRGFACIRPPGHHAEPDKAMGFCLFNNVALGARYLLKRHNAQRVMIVDIDVHHGNGTQKAYYLDPEVLFVSLHQFPAYPGTGRLNEVGEGRGEGYTVNVPLGPGQTDWEMARIVYFLLNPLAKEFQPDVMLVSCGFDLYLHDRFGGMRVTPDGYALITFFLLDIAEKVCNGRIAFIMEGGYSLQGIRECGARVMRELCDIPTLSDRQIEKVTTASPMNISILRKLFEIHKKYWNILRL